MKTKRRVWRWIGLVLLALLLIGGIALAIWLQPFPASQRALSAMQSGNGVTVSTHNDLITFMPNKAPKTGLIFYPGARVAPEAYAVYMHAFAEQGYAAFIVKMPFNLAFLNGDRAAAVIGTNPSIENWVIGGHSLGGVPACSFADKTPQIKGLLLYASYPGSDMSKNGTLAITSISGSNDAIATPAKVAAAKSLLPKSTRYVTVAGGIHSYFGDYGLQDGDGQATISREQAQARTIEASLDLLRLVDDSQ